MKHLKEFKFEFKGSRTYVHGTDIYKAFWEYYQANESSSIQSLQISFHGMSRQNLELVSECDDEEVQVLLTVTNEDGDKQKYYLRETEDAPAGRYPYDEEAVVDGWLLEEEGLSAYLEQPKGDYTSIESLVALNKAFLTEIHSPDGKWLFARLKIKSFLPANCRSIRLRTNSTSNLRLVRSKIEIDGEPFGEIYFSLT